MNAATALTTDLANLVRVLDVDDVSVERSLRALRFDVAIAVPSFVGLAMHLVVEGQQIVLTAVDEGGFPPIGSSLRLPVSLTAAVAPGSYLVLYATAPGAFVDLAADLAYALPTPAYDLCVDQDLTPTARMPGLTGVMELSLINRALGLLVGRGYSPQEARDYLRGKAVKSSLEVYQTAAYMVSLTE